ncbi:flagellar FlbD family protein [Brassicibacter mesophilus]|uniref:flagellar FlbD family protein n=1 Tax=Brassicibacter mesophilus TaxID=745119 RepID=UPI003D1935DD
MIELRKLNDKAFILNCELIESIEETPDTVITLTTGKKLLVKETVDEIINKVITFKNQLFIYRNK